MHIPLTPKMAVAVTLIAAAESIPTLPAGVQYGILGIGITVLATGKVVVPTGWLKDEREARGRAELRAERSEEEVRRLNAVFQDRAIPALLSTQEAMLQSQRQVSESQSQIQSMIRDLGDFKSTVRERNRRRGSDSE